MPNSASSTSPAAVEFNHTDLIDGGFFAENEKTFLSVVIATGRSGLLQDHDRSSKEKKVGLSNFEELPYEVVNQILEGLDISSLVTIASVNKYVRSLVQSVLDVKWTQQSIYSTRAVSQMYKIGTGKNFTLKNFLSALTSSSCSFCDRDPFAVSFCLMSCSRRCCYCELEGPHQQYLPVEMAAKYFGLPHQDMIRSEGFAQVPIPLPHQNIRSGAELRCGKTYNYVDIIRIKTALVLAARKYRGMFNAKARVSRCVQKQDVVFKRYPHRATETICPGFAESVRSSWAELRVNRHMLKRLLLTSLPYMKSTISPFVFEPGFKCQGCIRKCIYEGNPMYLHTQHWIGGMVYLYNTFINHLSKCPAAKLIHAGRCLSYQAEFELFHSLREKKMAYWPKEDQAPEEVRSFTRVWPRSVDWTAQRFRFWHRTCMDRIIELGELDLNSRRLLDESRRRLESKDRSVRRIFVFKGRAKKCTTSQQQANNDVQGKRDVHVPSRLFESLSRPVDGEAIKSVVLQDRIDTLPRWLLPPNEKLMEKSHAAAQILSDLPDWPRCEFMTFTSGKHLIEET